MVGGMEGGMGDRDMMKHMVEHMMGGAKEHAV